ncbi:glycine zipper family protein [Apilactobacillus sp. TMW 2.2459]|uniref:glycine zipper family protein n=1 Tax=Apilactobacillus xinyiensis TaxID=2841032 RepID=UPI00200E20FB|nr:glycine zipper family protein [Apilactobacillus xinyiensis]MCL0312157.1 glycine zipper family protein [Apilactobacillus xinyiensis]
MMGNKKRENNDGLAIGIGIGITFGPAIGLLFKNPATGFSLGLPLGVVIGLCLDRNKKD